MNTKMILRSVIALLTLAVTAGTVTANANIFGEWQLPSPLDGTWEVSTTPVICATGVELPFFTVLSYITIASGGSVMEATSNADFQPGQRSSGLGAWERTGRKSYQAFFKAFVLFDTVDPLPPPARSFHRGTQRIDHTIEMQDSNHWTSTATVTYTDLSGDTVFLSGCAHAVAERLQ